MQQRPTTIRTVIPAAALIVLTACGGGEQGPGPAPGGPSPVPASLAISPPTDFLRLRATETLTAVATMSNGTTQSVTATWSTDNAAVASVDASGRVTGSGSGQAGITAAHAGLTALRSLRVVPDYQGRWSGDHTTPNCVDDGEWRQLGFCDEIRREQSLFSIGLVLTQNRDVITGTIDLGSDAPGAIQGTIRVNGDLSLSATFVGVVEGIPLEVTVSDWETRTTDNQQMTGRFRMTFRASGIAGSATVDAELRVFGKTGTALAAPARDARRALLASVRKILR